MFGKAPRHGSFVTQALRRGPARAVSVAETARSLSVAETAPMAAGRWVAAGVLCGALVALVVHAPAAWLSRVVSSASEQRVWLAQPQGTVWNGSAQLVLAAGEGSRDALALPDRLHWRMAPGLQGWMPALRVTLDLRCCAQRPTLMDITPGSSGLAITLRQLALRWPAAVLSGLGTPWNTLRLEGTLSLSGDELAARHSAGRWSLAGAARLDALDISSSLSTLRPLGSYRLELTGGAGASLALRTLDGGLKLTGDGQWVGNRLRFRGEASAEPGREDALSNLLNLIGRRQGERSMISIG